MPLPTVVWEVLLTGTPNNKQLIRLLPKRRQHQFLRDVAAFLIDRQAQGLSSRTLEFYRDELHYLADWLAHQDVTDTLAATPDHLRRYLLGLAERRNAGGVHAAYRAAKAFLRWYEAEYEPDGWRNPITKVKPPRLTSQPIEPVSVAHIAKMLATCHKTYTGLRDRAILLALLDTGCRASEFLALDVSDVNLMSGAVIVRQGKGGKFRTVFLGVKTRREVVRYLRLRG